MPNYYANPSLFPMEGGCACGLTRYRISQSPMVVHCCHCTSCQRETGTAFALNAIIETQHVKLLHPAPPTVPASVANPDVLPAKPELTTPILYAPATSSVCHVAVEEGQSVDLVPHHIPLPSESGDPQTVARCARCGVGVWSHYAGGGSILTFIRVGTLDRAWEIGPDVHIYTRSRRDFFDISDGRPQFETFYRDKKQVYRPEALERFDVILPELKAIHEARRKKA